MMLRLFVIGFCCAGQATSQRSVWDLVSFFGGEECVIQWMQLPDKAKDPSTDNRQNIFIDRIDPSLVKDARCLISFTSLQTFLKAPDIRTDLLGLRVKKKVVLAVAESAIDLEKARKLFCNHTLNFDFHVSVGKANGTQVLWSKMCYSFCFKRYSTKQLKNEKLALEEVRSRPMMLSVAWLRPFVYFGNNLYGIDVLAWKNIASQMSLRINFLKVSNPGKNINLVRQGLADFSSLQLILNWRWRPLTDVSTITSQREIFLGTKYPENKTKYLALVEPFQGLLWAAVGIAVMTMTLSLLIVVTLSGSENVDRDPFLLFCIAVGVMINEGIPDRLLSIKTARPTQILIVFWVPMALLLGMAYQSNLLASLVKVGKEKPIDTYQDIIDQKVAIHMPKGFLSAHLLSTSPLPVVRRAFTEQISYYRLVKGTTPSYVFESIAKGNGTYDTIATRYFGFRHRFRRGKHLDIGIFAIGYYHGINHPLAGQVNNLIGSMVDAGIFIGHTKKFNWLDSAVERKFHRNQAPVPLWRSLDMASFVAVFLVIAGLLSVALMVFGFETTKKL